ncbi:hypothetical protein [Bosea sp. FBZP-16]|uniref:hypothetical protein n=1 Tax=Bosea sp. FBZP-16 TaxID=2065382 RepID=UPI001319D373|nr:hypothetical protein [Bosea sp. FBZP-16]
MPAAFASAIAATATYAQTQPAGKVVPGTGTSCDAAKAYVNGPLTAQMTALAKGRDAGREERVKQAKALFEKEISELDKSWSKFDDTKKKYAAGRAVLMVIAFVAGKSARSAQSVAGATEAEKQVLEGLQKKSDALSTAVLKAGVGEKVDVGDLADIAIPSYLMLGSPIGVGIVTVALAAKGASDVALDVADYYLARDTYTKSVDDLRKQITRLSEKSTDEKTARLKQFKDAVVAACR